MVDGSWEFGMSAKVGTFTFGFVRPTIINYCEEGSGFRVWAYPKYEHESTP